MEDHLDKVLQVIFVDNTLHLNILNILRPEFFKKFISLQIFLSQEWLPEFAYDVYVPDEPEEGCSKDLSQPCNKSKR